MTSPPGPAPLGAAPAHGRIRTLDALRGIAALWVLVYHDTLRYPRFMQALDMPGDPVALGFRDAELGVVPVLWFFIISGFVITWTVDRARTPLDFVVSRVSRLYPAYWAAIAVTLAVGLLWPLPIDDVTPVQVLANLTMLQEFVGQPPIDGVYWSLAVELRFYAYALILFAAGQWRRVHWAMLAWAALCLAAAAMQARGHWVPWRVQQALMLQYGPLLAAGMALYHLWVGHRTRWAAATLAACCAAILIGHRLAPSASCLAALAAVWLCTQGRLRWLATPPLLWLGAISYSLYLSHENVSFTIIAGLDGAGLPHPASIAVAMAAALLLATAITYGVERPGLHWLRAAWKTHRQRPPRDGVSPGRKGRNS